MWTIGFADRLRFPHFPSKLEKWEMLAFAHIPTDPTDRSIDIDGSKIGRGSARSTNRAEPETS